MGNADLRARLGGAAISSMQSYSRASIVEKWNTLLQSVTAGPGETPRQADRTAVLYIMGSGRSGSTLLGAMLNAHPDVFDAGELCNLHSAMDVRGEFCACKMPSAQCRFWADVRRAWRRTSPLEEKQYWALQANFERLLPFHTNSDRWRLYAAATAELFKAIASVSGAKIIVDSSKHPVRALALAQNGELDMRVIHLVRDVRGVAHSLSHSWDVDPVRGIALPLLGQPLVRSAAAWLVNNLLCGRVSASLRKRSMRMRYEDLVHDPVEALRRVSTLVDLDYSQIAQKILQGEALKGGHQIAGNRLRMQEEIRLRPDTTWQKEMKPWSRRWLWLMTSPMMALYGYRP